MAATPERAQSELLLQLRLGQVLQANHGYNAPETEAAFTRARALARELGNPGQLVQILRGHFGTTLLRGEMEIARALADELHEAARLDGTPKTLVVGHFDQGVWRYYRAQFSEALDNLQRSVGLWDEHLNRDIPNDPGIEAHSYMAPIYLHLGMADRARVEAQTAVALAERLMKPFDIAFTRHFNTHVQVMLGDLTSARESAELAVAHCREARVPHFSRTCGIFLGWVMAQQGHHAAGLGLISENLRSLENAGVLLEMAYYMALLAEAQISSGAFSRALETVREALTLAPEQEVFMPYSLRVRGDALFRLHSDDEAEQAFLDAISFSRKISDSLGELRATTALVRLFKARGDTAEAQETLAPMVNRVTEGFDTPVISQAKELLALLGGEVVSLCN